MKRLILSLAAVAAVAGPMAFVATSAQADDDHRGRGRDRHEQRWDRHDDRRDWDRRGGYDRRDWDRHDNRRGERWGRHDNGLHKGWDRGRHNF